MIRQFKDLDLLVLESNYDPHLLAYHSRRPIIRGFASQMYKYGTGRGQLVRRAPTTLRPAHLAPMAILLYLIAAPFLWAAAGSYPPPRPLKERRC